MLSPGDVFLRNTRYPIGSPVTTEIECIPPPSSTGQLPTAHSKISRVLCTCVTVRATSHQKRKKHEPNPTDYARRIFSLPVSFPTGDGRFLRVSERTKFQVLHPVSPNLQAPLPICEGYLLELLANAHEGGEVAGSTGVAKGDGGLEAVLGAEEHGEVDPVDFCGQEGDRERQGGRQ